MKPQPPVGVIVCAALVLLASFMPWGSFQGSPTGPSMFGMNPFGMMQVTFTINAWNGNITFLGVTVPNWVTVAAAVAIAAMAWLKAYDKWDAPAAASIGLSVYGILHLGLMFLILASKGQVGIGSLITLACFIALLVLSVKHAGQSQHVETSETDPG